MEDEMNQLKSNVVHLENEMNQLKIERQGIIEEFSEMDAMLASLSSKSRAFVEKNQMNSNRMLSNTDKHPFPSLECFTSIAQALGPGFWQFSEPVFQRCTGLIESQQLAKDQAAAGVPCDKEFIICPLDLLSGLTKGLGGGIESLVAKSNLADFLLQCCVDEVADIRQSALALLGNLARACPVHLHARLQDFLNAAAKQLSPTAVKEYASVANNACWAIGEIAIKAGKEISPVVPSVIFCLVPILKSPDGLPKSLLENSAITLGRLGWVCPDVVSPHIKNFMQPWCDVLCGMRDDFEKEDAFRGLCALVRTNPQLAMSSLPSICKACASWHEIRSHLLLTEVSQVLTACKQMSGPGWVLCMATLDPQVVQKLSRYGI